MMRLLVLSCAVSLFGCVDESADDQPLDTSGSTGQLVGWEAPAVVLNEFMASNQAAVVGPDGVSHPDWLELFNAGPEAVDLSGWYLSDDADDPTKFRLPEGVQIEAGGFVVVWTDESDELGIGIHANFRLDVDGETIVLTGPEQDGLVTVDLLDFNAQVPDVSMGRLPDGSGEWGMLDVPTPGASNSVD